MKIESRQYLNTIAGSIYRYISLLEEISLGDAHRFSRLCVRKGAACM
jgi:hypothetical protein